MYNTILEPFFACALLICIIGVTGIVLCCFFTTKAAGKIANDISKNMSRKIEENIKRDIDNGKFYYD